MSVVAKLTFFQNDLNRPHKGFPGNFQTSRKTSLVVRFLKGAPQQVFATLRRPKFEPLIGVVWTENCAE